jgi:hypothetical protein
MEEGCDEVVIPGKNYFSTKVLLLCLPRDEFTVIYLQKKEANAVSGTRFF